MKLHSKLFALVAASCVVASVAAQSARPASVVEPVPDPQSVSQGKAFGNVLKASDLIGMAVERGNRQGVGKVEDIVVGLETGRVVAVVVSLSENSTLRAVPPGVLHYDLLQKAIHLKAPPAKLEGAPVLERPAWKKALEPDKLAALYRHYDVEPSFAVSGQEFKDAPPPLGVTEMATKLDGAPVKNIKGDQIGQVQNCMVDLSTGRIPFVIVSTGAYIGDEGALSPVPAQAMNYDKGRAMFVLDTTRDSLAKLPHFKPGAWPDMNKGTYLADVYVAYGVKPREATTPAPEPDTAKNSPQGATQTEAAPTEPGKTGSAEIGEPGKLSPLDQGNSKEDVALTAAIRKELMSRKDLTLTAKNIQVITKDGKVTLSGPVNSKDEKNVINAIAAKHAGGKAVDNRLDVK